jgi:hypothetical protein
MIYTVSVWLLPVIIAITFHEAAHGFVARSLGDDTASRLGRVSLNCSHQLPAKLNQLIGPPVEYRLAQRGVSVVAMPD